MIVIFEVNISWSSIDAGAAWGTNEESSHPSLLMSSFQSQIANPSKRSRPLSTNFFQNRSHVSQASFVSLPFRIRSNLDVKKLILFFFLLIACFFWSYHAIVLHVSPNFMEVSTRDMWFRVVMKLKLQQFSLAECHGLLEEIFTPSYKNCEKEV